MKMISTLFLALSVLLAGVVAEAATPRNVPFSKVFYLATPAGNASGVGGYSNAKGLTDADLFAIEPGMVIENVYVIVDQAVLGTTGVQFGDDDSAAGFLPTAATNTYMATPQMLGWSATAKGTYLKDGSVSNAKYYSAAGKEFKLDATGALAETGKLRVVVEGFRHAYP